MTIENLGVKLYSGLKQDRKSDSLGSSADGSNTGITLLTAHGDFNQDALSFTSDGMLGGDFTIAGWIYPTSSTGYPTLFYNGEGGGNGRIQLTVMSSSSPKIELWSQNKVAESTSDWTLNTWQHVAITASGSTWKIYIDGTENGSGTAAASTRSDDETKLFAAENTSAANDFVGRMKTWCIYNRALSATDIGSLADESKLPTDSSLNTSSSLKLYLPMTSNFNDSSGNSVTINTHGDPSIVSPKLGTGAYSFNGSSSRVAITPTGLVPASNFTIAGWAKLDSGIASGDTVWRMLIGSSWGLSLYYTSTGTKFKVEWANAGSGNITSGSVSQDTWYHVALVNNSGTLTLYLNGTSQGTGTISSIASSTSITLGSDGTGNYWSGSLDDFGIWSRSLSATEITALYNSGTGALVSSLTNKSELKANYTMDSTSMSSLYSTDFTSDSNNALWSEQDTSTIGISDSNDRIDFEIRRNASNDSMSYDLGKTLDSEKWTMRCKLKFTDFVTPAGGGSVGFIGLSDKDSSSSSAVTQDFIGLMPRFSNSEGEWFASAFSDSRLTEQDSAEGAAVRTQIGGNDELGSNGNHNTDEWGIQIKRTSATKCKISLWKNHTFTGNVWNEQELTITSAYAGFRYIVFKNTTPEFSALSSHLDGYITDIEVWDGSEVEGCANDFSSTSALEALSGVRTNSIFQQTDTPSYWWYNGTSWVLDGTTLAIDEDFSTNNFTSNDTNVTNVVDGALNYWGAGQSVYGDGAYYKTPVTLDDNKWVMRARYEIEAWASPSGDSYQVYVGMIKFTTAANAQGVSSSYNQDGISFGHRIGTGTNGIRIGASDVGGELYNNFETLTSLTGTRTCWIELTRLSSTTSKLEVFSDEGFTTSIGATPTLTHGAVTGLDTIMINSQQGNGTGGANHGNIDNLQIQNGTSEWLE